MERSNSSAATKPAPASATWGKYAHRRLRLQSAAGTPCNPNRPDGDYWGEDGYIVTRPLRPTTTTVQRGFIPDFEPPKPTPKGDAPKPRPYANMRVFVAKPMIDKPVYDSKPKSVTPADGPTTVRPIPQPIPEGLPTGSIPKFTRNPRYHYYHYRVALYRLGPEPDAAKPKYEHQPKSARNSAPAATATQQVGVLEPMVDKPVYASPPTLDTPAAGPTSDGPKPPLVPAGPPAGPTPRSERNPRYDYRPRAVRPKVGPKPKSGSKPKSVPTPASAVTPEPKLPPRPVSKPPTTPQPTLMPTPRTKPAARTTPRRVRASSSAMTAPQPTAPYVRRPANVLPSKPSTLVETVLNVPPVRFRPRLTLLSHLEPPVQPHLWNPLPAPTQESPKGAIWSPLLMYVWPRHFPRVRSSPKSSVSYGLRWHVALLAKAKARAWDLITALDDLGGRAVLRMESG